MMYKGKAVRVHPYSRKRLDSLQLDAKRIMGLEPAKRVRPGDQCGTWPTEMKELPVGHPQRHGANVYGHYLVAPEEGDDTWNYAQRLLELEWPAVSIWGEGPGYKVINLSDLEELPTPETPPDLAASNIWTCPEAPRLSGQPQNPILEHWTNGNKAIEIRKLGDDFRVAPAVFDGINHHLISAKIFETLGEAKRHVAKLIETSKEAGLNGEYEQVELETTWPTSDLLDPGPHLRPKGLT